MVRVVNPQPHHSVVKQCVCGQCGAQLEYVPNEIQEYKTSDYGGGTDINYYIGCPQCGNKVHVKRY